MVVQIQVRRDTAANWTSADPTLAEGEMGLETDTTFFKFGDGSTAWTSLPYVQDGLGVPAGGTTGQRLAKASNADYDVEWVTAAAATIDLTGDTGSAASIGDVTFAGTGGIAVDVNDDGGGAATVTIDGSGVSGGGGGDAILGKSGRGGTRISGLDGSVDADVAGTNDDEFNTSALTGWTTFGSPDVADADTTRKGHLYLKKNAASGAHVAGIYKANPTMPFTMTAKLSDIGLYGSFNMAGIFVGVTNPASGAMKCCLYQVAGVAGQYNPGVIAFSNPTTYNGGGTYLSVGPIATMPIYLRIVATSSSNVTFLVSFGGRFFIPVVSANNPGFTIGSVGVMVNPDSASNPAEADFDWIRFT